MNYCDNVVLPSSQRSVREGIHLVDFGDTVQVLSGAAINLYGQSAILT